MKLDIPNDYSVARRDALQALGEDIQAAGIEPQVAALVVYGSVARREARPDSDVNLAVVLRDTTPPTLAALRPAFRAGFRTARVEPFVLLEPEIARLCDVFPAKLLDIQAHHDCIFGRDPFQGLEIAWADLRFRVEQGLRNQLLQMRRFYVFRGDDGQQLGAHLDKAMSAIHIELSALLTLASVDTGGGLGDIYGRACQVIQLDGPTVERLLRHHAREGERTLEREQVLYQDLMTLLERAVTHVDRLEPPT